MAARICVLFVILSALATLASAYNVGGGVLCSSDSDCPASETHCSKVNVNPPCAKGNCVCRNGYRYDSAAGTCKAVTNIGVGSTCTAGSITEVYPWGAICNGSTVTCNGPNYVASGSVCSPQTMAAFGGLCQPIAANLSTTCNSTAGMICNIGNAQCVCAAPNMIYSSTLALCKLRTFGDTCSTTTDCDTGLFTNLLVQQGGPNCANSVCGCASGFTQVDRLNLDVSGTTTSLVSTCLQGYTKDLELNKTCTVVPETQSMSGAQVCKSSLLCFRCPEETTAATQGLCRQFNGAAGQNIANSLPLFAFAVFIVATFLCEF